MSKPGPTRIELRLRELVQLFNLLDPSPFLERDLDAAAEAFIVDWARESPAGREFELVVHLVTPPPPDRAAGAEDAVRNYFRNRRDSTRSQLRQLFKLGRWSLFVALVFLVCCFALSQLLGRLSDSPLLETPRLVLDIAGWVALWRPMEIFLYDWWPIRNDLRMYERLARMPVTLVFPEK